MWRTYHNLTRLLESEGATWQDIVRTTCYIRDIERDYAQFNAIVHDVGPGSHHLDALRSQLIKVHPRQPPGHRSTDPADLPSEQTTYALRDIAHLQRLAAGHGDAIGVYAAAVLDTPLPWTKRMGGWGMVGPFGKGSYSLIRG